MDILDIKVKYKQPKTGEVLVLATRALGDMAIFRRNPYSFDNSLFFKVEGTIIPEKGGVAYTLHTGAEEFPWERPEISKVYFNDPVTVVLWKDGTKTLVKAIDEPFDKEKGLAMAIAKKLMGNEGNYFNEIKKWTEG